MVLLNKFFNVMPKWYCWRRWLKDNKEAQTRPIQSHFFQNMSVLASEMTYIVSSGALNSTHSLTHSLLLRNKGGPAPLGLPVIRALITHRSASWSCPCSGWGRRACEARQSAGDHCSTGGRPSEVGSLQRQPVTTASGDGSGSWCGCGPSAAPSRSESSSSRYELPVTLSECLLLSCPYAVPVLYYLFIFRLTTVSKVLNALMLGLFSVKIWTKCAVPNEFVQLWNQIYAVKMFIFCQQGYVFSAPNAALSVQRKRREAAAQLYIESPLKCPDA